MRNACELNTFLPAYLGKSTRMAVLNVDGHRMLSGLLAQSLGKEFASTFQVLWIFLIISLSSALKSLQNSRLRDDPKNTAIEFHSPKCAAALNVCVSYQHFFLHVCVYGLHFARKVKLSQFKFNGICSRVADWEKTAETVYFEDYLKRFKGERQCRLPLRILESNVCNKTALPSCHRLSFRFVSLRRFWPQKRRIWLLTWKQAFT